MLGSTSFSRRWPETPIICATRYSLSRDCWINDLNVSRVPCTFAGSIFFAVNVLIPWEMLKAFIERPEYVRDKKGAVWPERVRWGNVSACRGVGMKSSSVGRAELYPPVGGLVSQPHARVRPLPDETQPLITPTRRHPDTPVRGKRRYADTFHPLYFPRPTVLPGKPAASKYTV